tara:strand:+ start:826 stop:1368 length:543 start_codon:yes stop_codon:yes gene_type:complete
MQTLKKKDIPNYKPNVKVDNESDGEIEELEEIEELDEFVNGMGAGISGDEKNANNSEIETAPQATSADHAAAAIQPNRYLYNIGGVGRAGANSGSLSLAAGYDIAKNKMLDLLEDVSGPQLSSDKTITDFNDNSIVDINELPSNVARKLVDLIDSVVNNNLSAEKTEIVIQYINAKLNAK